MSQWIENLKVRAAELQDGQTVAAPEIVLPSWNEAAVAAEVQAALSAIAATLLLPWLNAAQKQLLAVFRQQVEDYQARRDPLLFGAAQWIEGYSARWKAEHECRIAAA